MDFVFMLTRADATVDDALEVLDDVRELGLRHIGFKDVGVAPAALAKLTARIRDMGATSYLELVTTSPEAALQSARTAREAGVDRLLGGTQVEEVLAILAGSRVQYLPFPGRPFGHPTQLRGSADDIARDCKRYRALGAAGVDLLAYRSVDADPVELVRAARAASDGVLLVAGGVATVQQIRALADAGADAFTIGSAVFDGSFAPRLGSLRSQLKAVLDACR
jgi:methylmalonyl-CoA mutase cobalamin-binding subunit